VLDAVNFKVERGETFVIVGFSGAGKSVTLKHIIRLLTPDLGKIYVGDELMRHGCRRRLGAPAGAVWRAVPGCGPAGMDECV